VKGMIDVSGKPVVARRAVARGRLRLKASTLAAVKAGRIKKGDVIEVSRVAAVQAVKHTPTLLPLCHPLSIESVRVDFRVTATHLEAEVAVAATAKTGVEMEALAGVAAALLCAWDMTKYLEKDASGQYPKTAIEGIEVVEKVKGKPPR
jgi:cyclic pyranopterin monophosphate synthase